MDRRTVAAGAVGVGVGLIAAGSLLPWFRSGRRQRSSYELFDLVDRLDLVPNTMASIAVTAWFAVPALVAATVAALLFRRDLLAAGLALVLGSYTAVLASVVASETSRWEAGTLMAAAGGIVAIAGGILLLSTTRRTRRAQAEPA